QYSRHALVQARRDGRQVTERDVDDAGERPEPFAVTSLACGCQRAQGATVKGALEGDDVVAIRLALRVVVAPRELQQGLDGLGAGVAEERACKACALTKVAREQHVG